MGPTQPVFSRCRMMSRRKMSRARSPPRSRFPAEVSCRCDGAGDAPRSACGPPPSSQDWEALGSERRRFDAEVSREERRGPVCHLGGAVCRRAERGVPRGFFLSHKHIAVVDIVFVPRRRIIMA